jgi:hypothetical protein
MRAHALRKLVAAVDLISGTAASGGALWEAHDLAVPWRLDGEREAHTPARHGRTRRAKDGPKQALSRSPPGRRPGLHSRLIPPARVLARSPSSSSRAYACLTARARLRFRRSASIAPSNRAFMRRRVARLAWRTWMTALREARADAARALKSMKFFLVSGSRRAFMVRAHAHMRACAPRCAHARTCAGLEASRGAPEEVPRLVRRAAACDAGTTQICAPRSLRQSITSTLSFRNGFCPLHSWSS